MATCKGCGKDYHHCSSCDPDPCRDEEYCSDECWKSSKYYLDIKESHKKFYLSLNEEQRKFIKDEFAWSPYDNEFEYCWAIEWDNEI